MFTPVRHTGLIPPAAGVCVSVCVALLEKTVRSLCHHLLRANGFFFFCLMLCSVRVCVCVCVCVCVQEGDKHTKRFSSCRGETVEISCPGIETCSVSDKQRFEWCGKEACGAPGAAAAAAAAAGLLFASRQKMFNTLDSGPQRAVLLRALLQDIQQV